MVLQQQEISVFQKHQVSIWHFLIQMILEWKIKHHSKNKIIYQLLSKNLDQGFPGDLNSECVFEIKNKIVVNILHLQLATPNRHLVNFAVPSNL